MNKLIYRTSRIMSICSAEENPSGAIQETEVEVSKSMQAAASPVATKPSSSLFQTTPDANALIRSISTPVDKYTGTAGVKIPLAQITTNSGSIPVSLSYQASGIKVTDQATTVGLGWRLAAGGRISRMVNGSPELGHTTSLRGGLKSDGFKLNAETFDYYFRYAHSSEPDIYFFEMPGMSGMIVMDEDGYPYPIPYQNLQIKFDAYRFEIKDNSGTVYHFNTYEKTKSKVGEEIAEYISTWYLDKIEYMDGTTVIFGYHFGRNIELETTDRTTKVTVWPYKSAFNIDTQEETVCTVSVIQPKFLEFIQYKNSRVDFLYDSNRSDLSWPRLSKVELTERGNKIKAFKLLHSIFRNTDLKLKEVQEESVNGYTHSLCQFEYYEEYRLPWKDTNSFDHWGYYNGERGTDKQTYPQIALNGVLLDGISREPDLKYAQTNSLKKIVYGTGGYKEFEYELHSGTTKEGEVRNAGGLRIRRISEKESGASCETERLYEYEGGRIYADTFNYTSYLKIDNISFYKGSKTTAYIHRLSYRPINPIIDMTGTTVVYSMVKEQLSNGAYTKTFYKSLDSYPDEEAAVYCSGTGNDKPKYSDKKGLYPKTMKWWGRNLLQEEQNYDGKDRLTGRTTFTYKIHPAIAEIPANYLFIEEDIDEQSQEFCRASYKWISAPITLEKVTVYEDAHTLPSTTTYRYDTEFFNPVKVTVTDCENNCFETVIRYPKDYSDYYKASVKDNSVYNAMRYMHFNHLGGNPIEQITYKNGKVIEASLNEYVYHNNVPGKLLLCSQYKAMLGEPVGAKEFEQGYFTELQEFRFDRRYYKTIGVNEFDTENRPISTTVPFCNPTSVIYGYNGTLPVAQIENAVHTAGGHYAESTNLLSFVLEGEKTDYNFFNVPQSHNVQFAFSKISEYNNGIAPILYLYKQEQGGYKLLVDKQVVIPSSHSLWLEAGRYYFMLKSELSGNPYETGIKVEIKLTHKEFVIDRTDEVLHTSFEDLPEDEKIISCGFAKTGEKVLCGEYSLDLRAIKPGDYLLSYWEYDFDSTGKRAWVQVKKNLSVTRSTDSYTLDASPAKYIDEVRIMPWKARMSTCTFKPGIGKTSETDVNGVTTYYEYDDFGRISRILDNDRVVQKKYTYSGLNEYTVSSLSADGSMTSEVFYLDGLGRNEQTISVGASPSGKDCVRFNQYDNMGRADFLSYMPFTIDGNGQRRSTPTGDLNLYLKSIGFTKISDWQYAYSNKKYDTSVQPRVLKQGGPGALYNLDSNSGHTVSYEYRFNRDSDSVQKFTVVSNSLLCMSGAWEPNTLIVRKTSTPTVGNSVKEVLEFLDCHGNIIANEEKAGAESKRTYYVYDDLGRLRYIIPPTQKFPVFTDRLPYGPGELNALCYYFEYDRFGRKTKQYSPGRDYQLFMYDLRGRLVMSQNGNQRPLSSDAGKWSFVKYDIYNRPVMQGEIKGGTYESHYDALQKQRIFGEKRVPLIIEAVPNAQSLTGDAKPCFHGYTDETYPHISSKNDVAIVTYYDDYDWASERYKFENESAELNDTAYEIEEDLLSADKKSDILLGILESASEDKVLQNSLVLFPSTFSKDVVGKITGRKVKVIGTEESRWLTTALYYDKKYGTIQTVSDLYPGGLERVSNHINRVGQITLTQVKQTTDADTVAYRRNYKYDKFRRLLEIKQYVKGDELNGSVTVASYTYDERENISGKAIHNGADVTSYDYDLQGRLLSASSPYFSYSLNYDDPTKGSVRYDGLITRMQWKRASDKESVYDYRYDSSGQLSSAKFFVKDRVTPEIKPAPLCLSVPEITYDDNGNILSLRRTDAEGNTLHDLKYSYLGNRLHTVYNGKTSAEVFAYDRNGNMTYDASEGYRVEYNELDLPQRIFADQREIKYIYSADGVMLATKHEGDCIYYRNTMVYTQHTGGAERLQHILHPEGIIVPYSPGKYIYKYYKTDHTGAVRAMLAAVNKTGIIDFKVEQVTDYYPFGLAHSYNGLKLNRNLWAGKELQTAAIGAGGMLGLYCFGARFYNPVLGRWLSQDPAGQFVNPYVYCANSPLMYGDEDGEWIGWLILGLAVLGGYLGGAAANETWNVFKWNWKSLNTWSGIINGAMQGAMTAIMPYALWSMGTALIHTTSILAKVAGALSATMSVLHTASAGLGVITTVGSFIRNTRNAERILWGNFKYDTEGGIFQGFMRAVWEGFQQNTGYAVSQFNNMRGAVDDVSYFDGVTLVNFYDDSGKPYGYTMGTFINSRNITTEYKDFPMFMHEFGHTIQSRKYGPLYMFIVAIPSLISCEWIGDRQKHRRRWYEMEANTFAADYFKQYGIDWERDVNKYVKRRDQPYPTY